MLTAYKIEAEARQLFNKINNIKTSAKIREFCGRKNKTSAKICEFCGRKKNHKTKPLRNSASSAGEKITKTNLCEVPRVLREKK